MYFSLKVDVIICFAIIGYYLLRVLMRCVLKIVYCDSHDYTSVFHHFLHATCIEACYTRSLTKAKHVPQLCA